MRIKWIIVIFLLLFMLEGTVVQWILPESWTGRISASPQLVFLMVISVAIYRSRIEACIYGVIFGFFQDWIFYGHMLGVHSFTMGLVGYAAGLTYRVRSNPGLFSVMFIFFASSMAFEAMNYELYHFFQVVSFSLSWDTKYIILPSTLCNIFIAVCTYIPARRSLERQYVPSEMDDD